MKHYILTFLISMTIVYAQDKPIFIGNPYIKEYQSGEMIYARNIWDMQLYHGKIYLGAGNSSNSGPAQNAGRVDVISLNPKDGTFDYEYQVAEEQIDIFKVYGDILYIPGHDATENWKFGNIYRKYENRWYKNRTLPKALHVYDIFVQNNQIFTAVGLSDKGGVFISDNRAQDWKQIPHSKRRRVYSFLKVGDELFATQLFGKKDITEVGITHYNQKYNTFSPRFDLNIFKMFPDTKLNNGFIKLTQSVSFENRALYLGEYTHNDHQGIPFGLYLASMQDKTLDVTKVELPKGYIPRDILLREKKVYVLVSQTHNTQERIKVLKFSKNEFSRFDEIINFEYPSFARSFEEVAGCFYFGIGTQIKDPKQWKQNELKEETGDILKLCLPKEN